MADVRTTNVKAISVQTTPNAASITYNLPYYWENLGYFQATADGQVHIPTEPSPSVVHLWNWNDRIYDTERGLMFWNNTTAANTNTPHYTISRRGNWPAQLQITVNNSRFIYHNPYYFHSSNTSPVAPTITWNSITANNTMQKFVVEWTIQVSNSSTPLICTCGDDKWYFGVMPQLAARITSYVDLNFSGDGSSLRQTFYTPTPRLTYKYNHITQEPTNTIIKTITTKIPWNVHMNLSTAQPVFSIENTSSSNIYHNYLRVKETGANQNYTLGYGQPGATNAGYTIGYYGSEVQAASNSSTQDQNFFVTNLGEYGQWDTYIDFNTTEYNVNTNPQTITNTSPSRVPGQLLLALYLKSSPNASASSDITLYNRYLDYLYLKSVVVKQTWLTSSIDWELTFKPLLHDHNLDNTYKIAYEWSTDKPYVPNRLYKNGNGDTAHNNWEIDWDSASTGSSDYTFSCTQSTVPGGTSQVYYLSVAVKFNGTVALPKMYYYRFYSVRLTNSSGSAPKIQIQTLNLNYFNI